MNLSKLFEMQKVLDDKIELEKPPQPGEDRLAKKILALQVELGECANEWRGFKFWSADREARTRATVTHYPDGGQKVEYKITNPLLEEYVDCLHFILGIGNLIQYTNYRINILYKEADVLRQFLYLKYTISQWYLDIDMFDYQTTLQSFLGLGEMLGFTWEQIEQAYMSKNEVNHQRQATGY